MEFKELRSKLLKTCPFWDKKNKTFQVNMRPTGDKIFVWQNPPQEKLGSILIPESTQDFYRLPIGVVMAVGPGYVTKKEAFIKPALSVGEVIVFDKRVPWDMKITSPLDNKSYKVRYMGALDARLVISEDGEEIGDITPILDGI